LAETSHRKSAGAIVVR